jgi:hypothetical protein
MHKVVLVRHNSIKQKSTKIEASVDTLVNVALQGACGKN